MVGVSAVVMIALVTMGTMSVVTLRASVLGILDSQLAVAADGGAATMVNTGRRRCRTERCPHRGR